ncbi:MAG: DUF1566 domain-containing protein [Sulfurovum sp.]|nr:DUF1566 domain-containing protein [Sulfurovum sp.]
MKTILLIMVGLTVSTWASLSRDASTSVVTDSITGLQWQDNNTTSNDFPGAIQYCEDLTLAGKSDWRLPNINELNSIFDFSKATENNVTGLLVAPFTQGAVIQSDPNPAGRVINMFGTISSTTDESNTSRAWLVNFYTVSTSDTMISVPKYDSTSLVRCVRSN